MKQVTSLEIINTLKNYSNTLERSGWKKASDSPTLAERIEAHGIAPPDRMVLVRKELLDFIKVNMEVSGGKVFLPELAFRKMFFESTTPRSE